MLICPRDGLDLRPMQDESRFKFFHKEVFKAGFAVGCDDFIFSVNKVDFNMEYNKCSIEGLARHGFLKVRFVSL